MSRLEIYSCGQYIAKLQTILGLQYTLQNVCKEHREAYVCVQRRLEQAGSTDQPRRNTSVVFSSPGTVEHSTVSARERVSAIREQLKELKRMKRIRQDRIASLKSQIEKEKEKLDPQRKEQMNIARTTLREQLKKLEKQKRSVDFDSDRLRQVTVSLRDFRLNLLQQIGQFFPIVELGRGHAGDAVMIDSSTGAVKEPVVGRWKIVSCEILWETRGQGGGLMVAGSSGPSAISSLGKSTNFDDEHNAACGYIAHLTWLIARYWSFPLPHEMCLMGCRSLIIHRGHHIVPGYSVYPLYLSKSIDRKHTRAGMLLLRHNVSELLRSVRGRPLGPDERILQGLQTVLASSRELPQ